MPSLEPEALVRKAVSRAGVAADIDMVGWRDRLTILCSDLHEHARLSPLGRTIAHGQLVGTLVSRFRAHALRRRYAEIDEVPITAPIILLGQMRSGSTRMQRLLACDPSLDSTRFYESWNPVSAGWPLLGMDDRKLRGWAGMASARLLNPEFDTIHPTGWNVPDEEIGLHNLSIFGTAFEAQWRVPNYAAKVEEGDSRGVYKEFRRFLQIIRWSRRDRRDRPWVLKVPQFAQDVSSLAEAFPDARFLYLARDPAQVIASSASLVCNQMMIQSNEVDPRWVAREWFRKVMLRSERLSASKALLRPALEIGFEEVANDWRQQIKRVYHMLGRDPQPQALFAMERYMRASAAHGKGHRYVQPDIDPSVLANVGRAALQSA